MYYTTLIQKLYNQENINYPKHVLYSPFRRNLAINMEENVTMVMVAIIGKVSFPEISLEEMNIISCYSQICT